MVLSIIVGLLGVVLNYNVIKDMDWQSKPYSFYRHFQFVLAGIGALTWSVCLIGAASATFTIVVLLALVVTPILVIQYKVGSEGLCTPFQNTYYRMKDKLSR
jgi:uncharacterized membrane protein